MVEKRLRTSDFLSWLNTNVQHDVKYEFRVKVHLSTEIINTTKKELKYVILQNLKLEVASQSRFLSINSKDAQNITNNPFRVLTKHFIIILSQQITER